MNREYNYNIINDVYNWMITREKDIEVRLLKEKSNMIQVGDFIRFNNQDNNKEYIYVQVIDKKIYDNVDELIKNNEVNRMMPSHEESDLKELLNDIYKEDLINGKLVAFTFKYLYSDKDKEKDEKILYRSNNWTVLFVSWCQEFPGDCIISSNMKRKSLSELTKEEWIELGELEKELERVCNKVLNATMYNFACLMNNAYRDNKEPNVHFHFLPRYSKETIIVDKKYKDKHFGYNFWKWSESRFKKQKDIFNQHERNEIFELMKKEWNY